MIGQDIGPSALSSRGSRTLLNSGTPSAKAPLSCALSVFAALVVGACGGGSDEDGSGGADGAGGAASSQVEVLVTDPLSTDALAVAGETLVYTSSNGKTVNRVPLTGGVPTVLSGDEPGAGALRAISGTLVWSNDFNGDVGPNNRTVRALVAGESSPKTIASIGRGIATLQVSGNDIFVSDGSNLMRLSLTGLPTQEPVDLPGEHRAWGLAVTPDRIIYTTLGSPAGELRSVPFAGGASTLLAKADGTVRDLPLDGDDVFFVAPGDQIHRYSLATGENMLLATVPKPRFLVATARGLLVATSLPVEVYLLPKDVHSSELPANLAPADDRDLLSGLAADENFIYLGRDNGGLDGQIVRIPYP